MDLMRRWSYYLRGRWIKHLLPKGLFGRTILIIVLPTFLALSVATFVFFDRHWYTVTHRMTHAVAGEVGLVIDMLAKVDSSDERDALLHSAEGRLDLFMTFAPGRRLPRHVDHYASPLREMLNRALDERLAYPHLIDMKQEPGTVFIFVEVPKGLYIAQVPQRRIYTPTTEVFIGWMLGSSILLSIIALLFMRNQVRPVRRLAEAAEAIGKGQDVPWFKLEGATEVRQAAAAVLVMHDRLRRSIVQRTTMLAGVSHDMRTPLTRMKLELAMMEENAHTRGFQADITEMENMLEAYLAFARGEEAEQTVSTDLSRLLDEIVDSCRRENPNITLKLETDVSLKIRPNAMRRCLTNLIGNALRYGTHAKVTLKQEAYVVAIIVDDDGPGIPEEKREDVFRPFLRLDESRNQETGGVGLGLTIARDIVRAAGGDIDLDVSPEGGLRAKVWLPI